MSSSLNCQTHVLLGIQYRHLSIYYRHLHLSDNDTPQYTVNKDNLNCQTQVILSIQYRHPQLSDTGVPWYKIQTPQLSDTGVPQYTIYVSSTVRHRYFLVYTIDTLICQTLMLLSIQYRQPQLSDTDAPQYTIQTLSTVSHR